MAKIVRSLSAKADQYGRAEILFRLTINRTTQLRLKTGLYVSASRFKNGEIVKPRANQKELEELREVEGSLVALEQFLLKLTETTPHEKLTKDFIAKEIDRWRNPEKYAPKEVKAKKM